MKDTFEGIVRDFWVLVESKSASCSKLTHLHQRARRLMKTSSFWNLVDSALDCTSSAHNKDLIDEFRRNHRRASSISAPSRRANGRPAAAARV